jgi:Cu-Zn family superoxide dismutase
MHASKLFVALGLALCAACTSPSSSSTPGTRADRAVCVLRGTEGHGGISGTVTFTRAGDGVLVEAEVRGLAPGMHGFHVHEWGTLDCGDGTCTGGHFNPHGKDHGKPESGVRHVGDLGNLVAGDDGVARYSRRDALVSLDTGSVNSILGRALIVHEKPDDFGQPTGNAGGRIAYGVIGIAPPAP